MKVLSADKPRPVEMKVLSADSPDLLKVPHFAHVSPAFVLSKISPFLVFQLHVPLPGLFFFFQLDLIKKKKASIHLFDIIIIIVTIMFTIRLFFSSVDSQL